MRHQLSTNSRAIIKIRAELQKLFVVSMLAWYYQINLGQSISVICILQSPVPDFSAKMHRIHFRLGLDPPQTPLWILQHSLRPLGGGDWEGIAAPPLETQAALGPSGLDTVSSQTSPPLPL